MSEADPPTSAATEAPAPVVIKKYANRRLYNTAQSCYVTLDHLADMVRREVNFVVYDARTGEDITRQVLTQIIFEEETGGRNILPLPFLRQLIGLYGGAMQAVAPSYLEASLDAFVRSSEQVRQQWMEAISSGAALPQGAAPPSGASLPPGANLFEEQVRNNLALMGEAMRMFAPPFARPEPSASGAAPEPAPAASPDALAELTRRMEEMQRQIAELARR